MAIQNSFTFLFNVAPSLNIPPNAVAGSSGSVLSPFIVPLNAPIYANLSSLRIVT